MTLPQELAETITLSSVGLRDEDPDERDPVPVIDLYSALLAFNPAVCSFIWASSSALRSPSFADSRDFLAALD